LTKKGERDIATLTKKDWQPWHAERKRFQRRDTKGYIIDFEALKNHIRKLQEVCPKDEAGWPVSTALSVINRLKRDFERVAGYLEEFH